MSTTSDFYLARAAESFREAENATLENVKGRCLRSAASWQAMAERSLRGEVMRDSLAAEKADRLVEPS